MDHHSNRPLGGIICPTPASILAAIMWMRISRPGLLRSRCILVWWYRYTWHGAEVHKHRTKMDKDDEKQPILHIHHDSRGSMLCIESNLYRASLIKLSMFQCLPSSERAARPSHGGCQPSIRNNYSNKRNKPHYRGHFNYRPHYPDSV